MMPYSANRICKGVYKYFADLSRDEDLLEQVPALATEIEKMTPERVPLLIRRWAGDAIGYGDV